jgi:hypothetical protein
MGVLLQTFYQRGDKGVPTPSDGDNIDPWWDHFAKQAHSLPQVGFTTVWQPVRVDPTRAACSPGPNRVRCCAAPCTKSQVANSEAVRKLETRIRELGWGRPTPPCVPLLRASLYRLAPNVRNGACREAHEAPLAVSSFVDTRLFARRRQQWSNWASLTFSNSATSGLEVHVALRLEVDLGYATGMLEPDKNQPCLCICTPSRNCSVELRRGSQLGHCSPVTSYSSRLLT